MLPQKYEEQIKTKQKIKKTAKLQKKQEKEEQARRELRQQWIEMQSDATRDQMERLEKNAKKINKKRRRQFFLWRWLGL
ncbi:MAG: hypothetical protein U5L09_03795 [Bacteroidales bacterium]|nr:hypothetical protein [Bacteroidales bacterium]